MSPALRRRAVERVRSALRVSERRACRALGQPRSTQRYEPGVADDETALTERIVALASEYGRYGYRPLKFLTLLDEYTRECLAIEVGRTFTNESLQRVLGHLFVHRRIPRYVRSDNGPEFTAQAVREWLERVGVQTLFIEPRSPWENGHIESFNGKLRDELLNGELFSSLGEARILIEAWRREYNQVRPHSSLGYRPPAPEAVMPRPSAAASYL
jgi:putative transposase